jgi:hypothetical protein
MIGTVLGILLGLLLATALVSGVALYFPFRRSQEFRWREQVYYLADECRRQQRRERDQLEQSRARHEAEELQLRAAAFEAFLAQIPVRELDSFPGIGPVTISKLEEAGFRHLARLRGSRPHIHGLGPKRLADLDSAMRQLLTKTAAEFDSGSPRESQQLKLHLHELATQYQQQEEASRARLRALEAFGTSLQDRLTLARQVTFPRYLRAGRGSLVPPRVLQEALPDLAGSLRAAEKMVTTPPAEDGLPRAIPVGPSPAPSPARPPLEGDRALLEISPSQPLSVELIRRQYHLLHERYDPEKLASKGPEFVALARAKQVEARKAAEALLRPFGQPLEEPISPQPPTDLRANQDLEDFFGA